MGKVVVSFPKNVFLLSVVMCQQELCVVIRVFCQFWWVSLNFCVQLFFLISIGLLFLFVSILYSFIVLRRCSSSNKKNAL